MLILPAQIILLTNTSLLTQISSANPHQFCQPRLVLLTNTSLLTQVSSANPHQFWNPHQFCQHRSVLLAKTDSVNPNKFPYKHHLANEDQFCQPIPVLQFHILNRQTLQDLFTLKIIWLCTQFLQAGKGMQLDRWWKSIGRRFLPSFDVNDMFHFWQLCQDFL